LNVIDDVIRFFGALARGGGGGGARGRRRRAPQGRKTEQEAVKAPVDGNGSDQRQKVAEKGRAAVAVATHVRHADAQASTAAGEASAGEGGGKEEADQLHRSRQRAWADLLTTFSRQLRLRTVVQGAMGIVGMLPLLKAAATPAHVSSYRGQRVAVDAYAWLHRGAYSCATELAEGKPADGYARLTPSPSAPHHANGPAPVFAAVCGGCQNYPLLQVPDRSAAVPRRRAHFCL